MTQFFVLPIASKLYNNKHFTVFPLISLMYVAWICNAELFFAYDIIEPNERLWNKINIPWNQMGLKDSLSLGLIFYIIVIEGKYLPPTISQRVSDTKIAGNIWTICGYRIYRLPVQQAVALKPCYLWGRIRSYHGNCSEMKAARRRI